MTQAPRQGDAPTTLFPPRRAAIGGVRSSWGWVVGTHTPVVFILEGRRSSGCKGRGHVTHKRHTHDAHEAHEAHELHEMERTTHRSQGEAAHPLDPCGPDRLTVRIAITFGNFCRRWPMRTPCRPRSSMHGVTAEMPPTSQIPTEIPMRFGSCGGGFAHPLTWPG